MAGSETEKPPRRGRPVALDRWARWLAGIVGVVGLGAGGTATFTRDVEAGPVALIAVGALFFTAALIGYLPTRLKFGDNEAEWLEDVGGTLAEVTQLVPSDSRAEATAALEDLAHRRPEVAAPAIAGLAYEQMVLEMLRRATNSYNERFRWQVLTVRTEVWTEDRLMLDALITDNAERAVAVEVKSSSANYLHYRMLDAAVSQLDHLGGWGRTPNKPALLITSRPLRSRADEDRVKAKAPYLIVIDIQDASQQHRLNAVLESLFPAVTG